MKRRVLSTIIALLLVAALLPMSVLAAGYTDTDGHWAESSIERWSDAGVVQGTGDAFAPDSDLTCAQLATILAKLLRLPAADDAGFSDNLADAWYYDAINRCAAAGILNGYADGTVRPNETISRARAMVMLARALGIEAAGTSVLNGYADAVNVPDWARGYVAALIRAGIVSGVSGSRLAALANITRAQFVTILDRAIAIYADEDGATVKADDVDGIIVVVAEDVQIKDAPAGTKVVAVASAKSLKVNGKSVDANDIHIVPETVERPKSVGHAHSHEYKYTDNGDGTHTGRCYANDSTLAPEAHNHDGENGACSICGAKQTTKSVASVKAADGYTYYTSLDDAINAGGEVTLLTNLVVDTQTIVDKEVMLDLAGHTLTSNSQPWVKDNGVLTITDSRDNGEIVLSSAGIMLNEGKLVLNKGKIHALTNSDVVFIMGTGSFTMHGGMLLADAGACIDASYGSGESKIDITGGTVTTNDTGTNAIYIASRFGQGKVIASISGGTFTTGGQPAVCVDDQNSTLAITGGAFSSDPSDYVASGYGVKNENGVYTVTEPVAAINNIKYATLAAAINAAQSGDTVMLLRDAIGSGISTPDQGTHRESLTIDFGGHTYTMENPAVGSTGTETQAMHWGRTLGKITLKNGTFDVAQGATDVAMAMQNYINLDAEDMVLDFTNITVTHYAENEFASGSKWAKYNGKECPMFNNNDENTEIKLTRCTVTLPDDSTLGGNISGTLTLVNSTFNGYLCFNSTDGRITVDSGSSIKGDQVRSYFDGELHIVCNNGTWTATAA